MEGKAIVFGWITKGGEDGATPRYPLQDIKLWLPKLLEVKVSHVLGGNMVAD